jgi:hypothetical protein
VKTITLPAENGRSFEYSLNTEEPLRVETARFKSRIAYAAAHVVATDEPEPAIDLEATLAYRRWLWALGFGVAEAMDTSQRGMGLDWNGAKQLIRASCAEARAAGRPIACGANTDQLRPGSNRLEQVIAAYEEQGAFIEAAGGRIILMASRALAGCAQSADDYLRVYGNLLGQVSEPVILHWLGEAFDPALAGYWGSSDVSVSMETCLALIHDYRNKIDGIKISLLDADREIEMRRRLPQGVRMYTGDDFHYPELIEGDEGGYSDALLGIFDGIAPAAALAFQKLDENDRAGYRALLAPTLPLSRHIFQTPTYHYKTGLAFLSYLNGRQRHFSMLGNQQHARSAAHLAQVFVLADRARLLRDPDLAAARILAYLKTAAVC